jgi:CRISPR-associated protein Cas1
MHAHPGKQELFSQPVSIIDRALSDLEQKDAELEDTCNRIMGLEGTAGRAYFQCLAKILFSRRISGGLKCWGEI